ncbi:MAG: hypothetical protein NTY47_08175, partial [Candidatus Omnitrophica bacterium]|nr:hypothetical protein [Candidatus Omnitrophota bacterium]
RHCEPEGRSNLFLGIASSLTKFAPRNDSAIFFMDHKQDIFRFIKIAGMVSFIPFVLVSGPLAGYLAGDFLAKAFGAPYLRLMCIGLGAVAVIFETFKIVRLVLKLDK